MSMGEEDGLRFGIDWMRGDVIEGEEEVVRG